MRSGAPVVAAWALWLAALSILLWIWSGDLLPAGLLTAAAVGWMLIAVYLAARRRDADGARVIVDSSLPSVIVAVGVITVLNGLAFGLWLVLIGGEILVLGLAGLVVELLDVRRARRRAS